MSKTILNSCLFLILLFPFRAFSVSIHDIEIDKGGFMVQESSIVIDVLKGNEVIPHLQKLIECI